MQSTFLCSCYDMYFSQVGLGLLLQKIEWLLIPLWSHVPTARLSDKNVTHKTLCNQIRQDTIFRDNLEIIHIEKTGYTACIAWTDKNKKNMSMKKHRLFHVPENQSSEFMTIFTWVQWNINPDSDNGSDFQLIHVNQSKWRIITMYGCF